MLAICFLPILLLSGCAKEKVVVKTKVVKVHMCAAKPVELVAEPTPLVANHTKERDVWAFAFQNRQALRACNLKLQTLNKGLAGE